MKLSFQPLVFGFAVVVITATAYVLPAPQDTEMARIPRTDPPPRPLKSAPPAVQPIAAQPNIDASPLTRLAASVSPTSTARTARVAPTGDAQVAATPPVTTAETVTTTTPVTQTPATTQAGKPRKEQPVVVQPASPVTTFKPVLSPPTTKKAVPKGDDDDKKQKERKNKSRDRNRNDNDRRDWDRD